MAANDQPGHENPDQASSDEKGASPARSYECSFCKRGFSNAQALGGHMNIHRRDKAKLKQASPSETISASYSPNHHRPSCTTQPVPDTRSCQVSRSSPGKWPWVIIHDDDDNDNDNKRDKAGHVGSEIRQLPLFYEKPSITDQNPSSEVQGGIEKGLSSSQGSSSGSSELDLELRLGGPKPQDSSLRLPTMTKNFF